MKSVQLNRIDVSVEKYIDRIWELTHSESYQRADKTKLKEIFRQDTKEEFYEVIN